MLTISFDCAVPKGNRTHREMIVEGSFSSFVVARIKKYIISSLRKKIEERNDDEVKKA